MPDRITPPEALIYAMVTVSAADRAITTAEIDRIGSIVRDLPPFRAYTADWLADAAQACGQMLRKPHGVDKVLELVKGTLPLHLYETAYVLCAEVAASDLAVHAEEARFLDMLAKTLELDPLVRVALERAARARHQHA